MKIVGKDGGVGKLTARSVAGLSSKGRYGDGDGLYLLIDAEGRKYWQMRYMAAGRRRDMSIGPERRHSLAQARELARDAKAKLARGIDPLDARERAAEPVVTFASAARQVHAARLKGWRNGKHQDQWLATLERHVFPVFGDKPLSAVGRGDVLEALGPIWLTTPETARRVRQRIGIVIDWGIGAGIRESGVDMRLVARALPRQPAKLEHFASLPFSELPGFMQALAYSKAGPTVRAAIQMMILTASRPGNIRLMMWDEVDFAEALWTIPAEKMKAQRPHRVPLARRTLDVLRAMQGIQPSGSPLVFGLGDKPMSLDTLRMANRRMGYEVTAHGFRSTFKEWSLDAGWADHLSEVALAHIEPNRVRAAYARSDQLEARRPMMEAWATFVHQASSVRG